MNIDGFKATISRNQLLDASRYNVMIQGPGNIGGLDVDKSNLCSACSIPGRGFSTVEKYDHGPIRKIPYAELYDDVTTTFYMPVNMKLHEYFDNWQVKIGGQNYYMGYYDDIIGSVKIAVQDNKDVVVALYELFEAYPISISPIDLAYDKGEELATFTVTWAYHHFEKRVLPKRIEPVVPAGDGTLDTAIDIVKELGRNVIRGGFDTPVGIARVVRSIYDIAT